MGRYTETDPGALLLGRRLAAARQVLGLSQTAVGARAGLTREAVGRVEVGARRLTAVEFARLAQAVRVRADVLLDGVAEASAGGQGG